MSTPSGPTQPADDRRELTIDDAPAGYGNEEAFTWLAGVDDGMARVEPELVRLRAELDRARRDYREMGSERDDRQMKVEELRREIDRLRGTHDWLSEACRLTVADAAIVRDQRGRLHRDATAAREKLIELIGGDWTVEPSLTALAGYAARFWGDDRKELKSLRAEVTRAHDEVLMVPRANDAVLSSMVEAVLAAGEYNVGLDEAKRVFLSWPRALLSGGNTTPADAEALTRLVAEFRENAWQAATRDDAAQHHAWKLATRALENVISSPGWGSAVTTPEPAAEVQPEFCHEAGGNYERSTPMQIKEWLEHRKLSTEGTKAELVARLRADDAHPAYQCGCCPRASRSRCEPWCPRSLVWLSRDPASPAGAAVPAPADTETGS